MRQLGELRCVFASSGLEMNFEELLSKSIGRYDEKRESEFAVIEMLRKHILRDEDQIRNLLILYEERSRKIMEGHGDAETMLCFGKMMGMSIRCSKFGRYEWDGFKVFFEEENLGVNLWSAHISE